MDDDVTGIAVEFCCGGRAGDDQQTKGRGDQTQKQQHPVTLLGEAFQFR